MTDAENKGLAELRAQFPDHSITIGRWGEAVLTPLSREQLQRRVSSELGQRAEATARVLDEIARMEYAAELSVQTV